MQQTPDNSARKTQGDPGDQTHSLRRHPHQPPLSFRTSDTIWRARRLQGALKAAMGPIFLLIILLLIRDGLLSATALIVCVPLLYSSGRGIYELCLDFPSGRIACFLVANDRTLAVKRGRHATRFVKRQDCLGFHFNDCCIVLHDRQVVSLLVHQHPEYLRFRDSFFESLLARWWSAPTDLGERL